MNSHHLSPPNDTLKWHQGITNAVFRRLSHLEHLQIETRRMQQQPLQSDLEGPDTMKLQILQDKLRRVMDHKIGWIGSGATATHGRRMEEVMTLH